MDSDQVSNYKGEEAERYESQVSEIAWHGHEILFGLMYEFVKSGELLLDIGIGTGLSSLLFHKAGLQVSGFDNSAEMIKGCHSKEFSGQIIQHDLKNVPYPFQSNSINHVISLGVLNFFSNLLPVFQESSRIIKKDGIFGFTVEEKKPEQEHQYTLHVNEETNDEIQPFDIVLYRHSDEDVRVLLKNMGFSVLKEYEFLADRYPKQEIEIFLKIYVTKNQGS